MSALTAIPAQTTSTFTYPEFPAPILLKHTPLIDETAGNPNALTGLSIWKTTTTFISLFPLLLSPTSPIFPPSAHDFLEIGCGTGLSALYLLQYLRHVHPNTKHNMHITDGDPAVVDLLNSNIALNDCPSTSLSTLTTGTLIWGSPLPPTSPLYSIIFGADLLYSFGSAVNPTKENNCVGGDTGGVVGLMKTVKSLLKESVPFSEPQPPDLEVRPDLHYKHEDFDHPLFAPLEAYTGGYFLLGIARRSVPIELIIDSMHDNGLEYAGVVDESVNDLFGNLTDGITDMWTHAVIVARHRGAVAT